MGLCALEPFGNLPLHRAVQEFGPVDVWESLRNRSEGAWARRAQAIDLPGLERETESCGARFVIPGDQEWPARLDDLAQAEVAGQTGVPFGVWVRGAPLPDVSGAVAIVGARACSSYGQEATLMLASDLAAGGRIIISGLAYGIDAAAHRGALGVNGATMGVVASGVNLPYPAANTRLTEEVAQCGGLVSEAPPRIRPKKAAFLARNRIIAALASAVVVVEAALRSGAKNTASWALSLGRPVLAVPGPLTSSLSATPHQLIRDGEAILVTSAQEIEAVVAPLGSVPESRRMGPERPIDRLSPHLRMVREAMPTRDAVSAAELSVATGLPMVTVLAAAGELESSGWLERCEDGLFRLPRRR